MGFCEQQKNGTQPMWPERLRKNLQAVVRKAGIEKKVGWHTFRHTLSTMLRANGEDIATQTELLRNSAKVALEHYPHAFAPQTVARSARSRMLA
ncbi:MAG TPA: tyrosine-type recombinase/integrase [Candidatus Angelobacter sp.]|nr:tyrosine-type recombinase/integrase [Candidatus Angelobacter sp.]